MPESDGTLKSKNSFRLWLRIKDFVLPFFWLFLLSIILNTTFSVFNAASIALIKPVIQLIIPEENSSPPVSATEQGISSSPAGNEMVGGNFLSDIKEDFYGVIQGIVRSDSGPEGSLINLSFLIIGIFILKNIFKYLGAVTSVQLEQGIIKSIRDQVFNKLTSLSVGYFTKNKSGTLISVIANDVAVLNSTTVASFNIILRELTQIIIFLFLLTSVSVTLTLIAFSTSIISIGIIRFAVKYLRRYAARMQTAMADYTSTLQETIAGIRVIKAYNAEQAANKRFADVTKRFVKSAVKHKKILTLIPAFNEVFAIVALCVVLLVGGSAVINGTMTADDFFLFLFTLFAIMSPITTVISAISNFQRGFVAAERVFDVLDHQPEVKTGEVKINGFKNEIEIRNIDFAYDDTAVLKDVSLTIPKGKKIAFVGPSGSGKSTILDLIIRFYDPDKGEILVDGRNIRDLDVVSYRSLFGIVSQETILFNDTIANNMKYGDAAATKDQLIEASKIANAHDFILKAKDGFDTYVGDRGITLSGGERQRVAIARALLGDPEILVFDEATSSLDAESEHVVQEAIDKSLKSKTAIIVAHRLSTIVKCDEIYVFDKGRIVEKGSHNELLRNGGLYKKLYDIQFTEREEI